MQNVIYNFDFFQSFPKITLKKGLEKLPAETSKSYPQKILSGVLKILAFLYISQKSGNSQAQCLREVTAFS